MKRKQQSQLFSNEWLNELKGYTYKKSVLDRAYKYIIENKIKALGHEARFGKITIVSCLDKDGQILAIGGSEPSDLILNNYANWFKSFIRTIPIALTTVSFSMTDVSGVGRTLYSYSDQEAPIILFNRHNGANAGTKTKLGKGVTPPARTDFKIETDFLAAPENTYAGTGIATYNSANGTIKTTANINNVTNTDVVKESGFFVNWHNGGGIWHDYMLSHDAIAPNVNFNAGNNLAIDDIWTI